MAWHTHDNILVALSVTHNKLIYHQHELLWSFEMRSAMSIWNSIYQDPQ